MPFWPNKARSCDDRSPAEAVHRPRGSGRSSTVRIRAPCPGLLDNFLAPSIARGGRLYNLAHRRRAPTPARANLTWAIDPALLDNVTTMRSRTGSADSVIVLAQSACIRPTRTRASWLASLTSATAGQQVFVTPYADVDLAGLAQFGNNTDLGKSFSDGQGLASRILHRDSKTAPLPAGPKQLSSVVWPANGRANPALLENLGAMKIGTVILAMPPSERFSYTPGAVTSTFDGVGTKLKVLLADDSLTGLLGSPAARSHQAAQVFNVSQLFEAETAMIVAQRPASQRPILITPPRRWDPSAELATDLLQDTVNAPWLRPSTLNQLAAQRREHNFNTVVRPYSKAQLAGKLLRQVRRWTPGSRCCSPS